MQLPKSRLETLRFTLPLRKRKKKQNALHFKCIKKKVCTLFSCWQLQYNQVYKNTSWIPI